MKLVFIYGPPAAGKLTVATELSRLTGFKLFHNHVSIQFVESLFEYGTRTFQTPHGQVSS
jgi:tRNA uridine 5-carbamoylmethylation protein Kti12